jgi:hypothetical protein
MRTGNLLILLGVGLVAVGVVVRFFPGAFSWFGNLPGDIRIEGENSRVYIPLTSMILVSLALSLLARFLGPFIRDR